MSVRNYKTHILVWGESKDKSITDRVKRLFDINNGVVPLEEFIQGLIDRFGYNPIIDIDKIPEEVDGNDGNKIKIDPRKIARSKAYPVLGGFVYEPSANVTITHLGDPKESKGYFGELGQRG